MNQEVNLSHLPHLLPQSTEFYANGFTIPSGVLDYSLVKYFSMVIIIEELYTKKIVEPRTALVTKQTEVYRWQYIINE